MKIIEIISNTFGPKYKHSNPNVRKQFIEGTIDLEKLREMVFYDPVDEVRLKAIHRIVLQEKQYGLDIVQKRIYRQVPEITIVEMRGLIKILQQNLNKEHFESLLFQVNQRIFSPREKELINSFIPKWMNSNLAVRLKGVEEVNNTNGLHNLLSLERTRVVRLKILNLIMNQDEGLGKTLAKAELVKNGNFNNQERTELNKLLKSLLKAREIEVLLSIARESGQLELKKIIIDLLINSGTKIGEEIKVHLNELQRMIKNNKNNFSYELIPIVISIKNKGKNYKLKYFPKIKGETIITPCDNCDCFGLCSYGKIEEIPEQPERYEVIEI